MTPGRLDLTVVRRHLLALDEALQVLRSHYPQRLVFICHHTRIPCVNYML